MSLLYEDSEWTFDAISRTWKRIEEIAKEKYGLDYYSPQIEIITAQQMLEGHSSVAMPVMYDHWSFGKNFIEQEKAYKTGKTQLAYEVIINTNPLITYLMEDNSMTMQTIVLAHSIAGHGSFFKHNYLFQEWTDPDSILDYLVFAKQYIKDCEQKYGAANVEEILDAAHSIKEFGIDRYKRDRSKTVKRKHTKYDNWVDHIEKDFNDLWRTIPNAEHAQQSIKDRKIKSLDQMESNQGKALIPEENILYFIEKYSPILENWEREIIRIVRKIEQYFYPQRQTKMMNEGWASFIHYTIMQDLYDEGSISEGHYLEFLKNHTAILYQPCCGDQLVPLQNVYALGFAIFKDIKRICENPDDEDRELFPDIAGTDWIETCKDAMMNYRDESFVLQFLSPKVMKDFKMCVFEDNANSLSYLVSAIQSKTDLKKMRNSLAEQFNINYYIPHIEVTKVLWNTSRTLELTYYPAKGKDLSEKDAIRTADYISMLWGFRVRVRNADEDK